jgi:FkbM family methyltransferase
MVIHIVKDRVKKWRDGFYSKTVPGKITLGHEDQWTILTHTLFAPIVYSGGVGKNISFELELIKRFNAQVYLFDPSATGIKTMKDIPALVGLHFSSIALSNHDGVLKLFFPVNPDEGSYTREIHKTSQTASIEFPCRKISSLMKENGHDHIDILKLDIEGSEYDVLEDILREHLEIDQICVEFHHFFDSIPKQATRQTMAMLKQAGYVMAHRRELDYLFCKKKLIG